MKKRILLTLIILGINLFIEFLAALSLMLFFARNDPILAAVPAVLALPGILLQPWFILFLLMSSGVWLLLAPVFTTAVTIPIYVFLDSKGKLDRAKLILARMKNRKTVIVIGIAAVCLFAIGFFRYIDMPVLRRGIPETLQYSLKDMHLTLSNPRYYCLGYFLDSEWLWQAGLPEQEVDLLADKLDMHPIPLGQIGPAYRHMPPYWWRPVMSDHIRVLSTPNFPMNSRGPDGRHALATWNPEDEVLHMWIKDNF